MALAGYEHRVAGLSQPDRLGDRGAPVADLDHLGPLTGGQPADTVQHGAPDGGRVLTSRVVVSDDEDIGVASGHFAHDRTLGLITIAAAPEHDHKAPGREWPQC